MFESGYDCSDKLLQSIDYLSKVGRSRLFVPRRSSVSSTSLSVFTSLTSSLTSMSLSPPYFYAVASIARYAGVIVEISEGSISLSSHRGLQLVDQSTEVTGHRAYVGTALNMRVDIQDHRKVLQMMVVTVMGFIPHISLCCIESRDDLPTIK